MSSARTRSAVRWSAAVLTVLAAALGVGTSQAAATPAVQHLASAAQDAAAPQLLVWNNTGS